MLARLGRSPQIRQLLALVVVQPLIIRVGLECRVQQVRPPGNQVRALLARARADRARDGIDKTHLETRDRLSIVQLEALAILRS